MIIDDVTGSGDVDTFGNTGTQPFQGALVHVDTADTSDSVVKANGASTSDDVLTLKPDTQQGSYVICVYDADNTRYG